MLYSSRHINRLSGEYFLQSTFQLPKGKTRLAQDKMVVLDTPHILARCHGTFAIVLVYVLKCKISLSLFLKPRHAPHNFFPVQVFA